MHQTNTRWDINQLRKMIEKLYGQEHLTKLAPSLNSIVERQAFSRLYFQESKMALDDVIHDKTDPTSLLKLVLPFISEEREVFEESKFVAKAHILSCIQNMHSVFDILGHVIYYSLNLAHAPNESSITLKKVRDWIGKDEKFNSLHAMLNELTRNDDYDYLSALANHSKHRSIIEPYFSINLRKQGKDMQEMRFRSFNYNKKEYPSRHVYDFLESEYKRESLLLINIGNEINKIVQDLATES